MRRPALVALSTCGVVGAAVALVGYFVIPPLYGTGLAGRENFPAVIGGYLALMGLGSVFLAYCNSAGRPRMLLWHYVGVLGTGSAALAAIYFAGGRHVSITGLAVALAVGQCYVLVSGTLLVIRERGRKRALSAPPLADARVSAEVP